MTEFRALFYRWVGERVDLARHLIFTGPGTPQSVLNALFSEVSFFIHNAPGAPPGPHRVRFDIPHAPAGLRLLLAARWFSQHGHWDPSDRNRLWDFPRGLKPADLQVELEDWLCDCAEQVEARFLQTICRRAASGQRKPWPSCAPPHCVSWATLSRSTPPDAVNAIGKAETRAGAWSVSWQGLAQPAAQIIQSLPPGLITEFAATRQGERGEAQVVDAAQLEPAAADTLRDPARAVTRLLPFPHELSVIEQARMGLPGDWEQIIAQERTELLATVRQIADALGSTDTDVAGSAAEFGRQANAFGAFRPRDGYKQFRQEIEQLGAATDTIRHWTGSEAALSQPDDMAAVFDAQPWAAHARAYAGSLRVVLKAVQETITELERRTAQQVGVNPDELAERVADQIGEVATLLGQLSQGGPA